MCPSKILLVDDEAGILSSLQRLLRQEAFEVKTTQSTEEAIQLFSSEEFAVVMSDQRMPDINGTELLEKLQGIRPNAVRILLTGYADAQAAIDAINKGSVYRFLSKPWSDDELKQTLRQAVTQYELLKENKRLNELTVAQNAELEEMNQTLEKKVIERTQTIAELNQGLQKSLLASVQMMAGLSEMHSGVIGSHSKRVTALSQQIAQRLGIGGWELLQIVIASTLHDIGKIGISAEILKHEDSTLSPNEIEMLKLHTVKGESILLKMENLQDAAKIVRHHHENFNGSGYPDRLAGEAIPVGARIIAVVDAYDKVLNQTSNYSSSTVAKALLTVKSHSSTIYDPHIVGLLASVINEGNQTYNDTEIEIQPKDLTDGMTLSRDLLTVRGVLLLQKGKSIEPKQAERLKNLLENDPAKEGIYIYRTQNASQ